MKKIRFRLADQQADPVLHHKASCNCPNCQIASSDARRIDCPQSFGSTRSWCMCKEESLDVRSSKAPYVMDVWKPGYGYGSCEGILKMHVECKRYT